MKKKPTVWLARDGEKGWYGDYVLSVGKKHIELSDGGWGGGQDVRPKFFEKIAPKSCHLKPGEGPVKISVKIERVK